MIQFSQYDKSKTLSLTNYYQVLSLSPTPAAAAASAAAAVSGAAVSAAGRCRRVAGTAAGGDQPLEVSIG